MASTPTLAQAQTEYRTSNREVAQAIARVTKAEVRLVEAALLAGNDDTVLAEAQLLRDLVGRRNALQRVNTLNLLALREAATPTLT